MRGVCFARLVSPQRKRDSVRIDNERFLSNEWGREGENNQKKGFAR